MFLIRLIVFKNINAKYMDVLLILTKNKDIKWTFALKDQLELEINAISPALMAIDKREINVYNSVQNIFMKYMMVCSKVLKFTLMT